MRFINRNRQILAFVLLALITGLALNAVVNKGNQTLYDSQLVQCTRGNKVIKESNRRIQSHLADTKVLRMFMEGARTARLAAFHQSHHKSDFIAARTYGDLIRVLDAKVHFEAIPLVNCVKVIPKP